MIHQNEQFYYDLTEKEYLWKSDEMKRIVDAIRSVMRSGSAKVLEIGCGIAGILPHLPQGIGYTGTDVSEFAIERAAKAHQGSPATFLVASADALPFENAMFDFVLAFNVIEHCRQPKIVLGELMRVLRPMGGIAITGPNLDFPFSISNGIRHKSARYKVYIRALRCWDYIGRIFGYLKFRTIAENFTEVTGRYEKPDDDLRYFCSSYEVIEYMKKRGALIAYANKIEGGGWKIRIKRLLSRLPGMRYYGRALSVILIKR